MLECDRVEKLGIVVLLQTPADGKTAGLEVVAVRPGDTDIATGVRSPDRLSAIPVSRGPHDPRDPWPRSGAQGLTIFPRAGQPGHGSTASLRRQPAGLAAYEKHLGLAT